MERTEAMAARSGNEILSIDPRLSDLTKREREVLGLIGRGLSTARIASHLHRSEKTVKSHRLALGRKLAVTNRVELARIAIETGLSPLAGMQTETVHALNEQLDREVAKRKNIARHR